MDFLVKKPLPTAPVIKYEKGIILIVTLVAMVILLISGVALIRSFDTSLMLAGNLSFKRDLVNQGERGFSTAIGLFSGAGILSTNTNRQTNQSSSNYSAAMLPSDAHGLPLMLTDDSQWTMTGADLVDNSTGITIRYVIDRLCNGTGVANTSKCVFGSSITVNSGTANVQKAVPNSPIVYRISIRVTGPRNTQSYMQSTISL